MPAAPAAGPGVSGDRQRQGVSRSRGCRSRSSGDGPDRRALGAPEEGLLLLTALRVVGGGAVALPQIRLWMPELTLLLPVSRHALEGAHTGSSSWDFDRSPRSGAPRSSARVELSQSGARHHPPRPSGVADVGASSTFARFRLA